MKRASVVVDRLSPFVGRPIVLRLTYAAGSQTKGTLVAVLPIGSDYFLHVAIEKSTRMINTRAVLEIAEA